ncbi:MAG: sigma-70 family RNA polymerase sigma factor [Chthoniobacterales bacterium]
MEPNQGKNGSGARRFGTTRWSIILAASAGSEDASRTAMAELCRAYWRPIFAFVCRRGNSPADAQDLTQDFFVTVLSGNLLQRADPERGRFRSLLLKSLQNFLVNEHTKRGAEKRGGAVEFVSWDDWMTEAPSHLSLSRRVLDSSSPEKLFDIRWAATVVERALARLREEYEAAGRRRVFDSLKSYLAAERNEISLAQSASFLGVPDASVKRLLHQLRVRYRALLREEVASTVATEEDVEDEVRHLCAVLAGQG